jgi:Ca-activated chloride channel family protein
MYFLWPIMLVSLAVVPLLVLVYFRLQKRRSRIAANFANFGGTLGAKSTAVGARRHVPPALFLSGLAILLVALARPQTVVAVPKEEGTVILAFDVSGSMAADDLKPTRMDAAKAAAQDFVQRQPSSVQIGVVAFSDSGFAVQAPTTDRDAVLAAIKRLAPQRGTSVANGILGGLNTIATAMGQTPSSEGSLSLRPTPTPTPMPKGTYTNAVMVMLSDGDNNEPPDPLTVARLASDRGIRIYTVGIGSVAGTDVHVNGFTVHTQLDEATLQQIAQTTGGAYFNAQNTPDLLSIYDHLNPQLVIKPERIEVTSLFAGASLLMMLIGATFSLLWFNRLP